MFVHRARRDVSRPAGDEGDAYAALVARALETSQFAVATEEGGVGATLLVRSVVRREDDERVFIQPFLLELGHDFTHVSIEAGNHGCKLGVHMLRGVVAAYAAKVLVVAEHLLVSLQDGVVGLVELGVWQRVGEKAVEGLPRLLQVEPLQSLLMDEVAAVLRAVAVFGRRGPIGVLRVLRQFDAYGLRVAAARTVTVQEVRVILVRHVLADVAVVLVDTAFVGRGARAFVAARPFAEHARGVAVVLHDFGQYLVLRGVRLLAHNAVLRAHAILHRAVGPILLVAAHCLNGL